MGTGATDGVPGVGGVGAGAGGLGGVGDGDGGVGGGPDDGGVDGVGLGEALVLAAFPPQPIRSASDSVSQDSAAAKRTELSDIGSPGKVGLSCSLRCAVHEGGLPGPELLADSGRSRQACNIAM